LPAQVAARPPLDLPRDRAEAVARGLGGPTIADIDEFQLTPFLNYVERCQSGSDVGTGSPLSAGPTTVATAATPRDSARHDQEWGRVVSCVDYYARPGVLREVVFMPGMLAGCWRGFLTVSSTVPLSI
jgi:hypothetical protein